MNEHDHQAAPATNAHTPETMQSPQHVRPMRRMLLSGPVLAPDLLSVDRIRRPTSNVETLHVDISGVAAQRYLARLISDLDADSSNESGGSSNEGGDSRGRVPDFRLRGPCHGPSEHGYSRRVSQRTLSELDSCESSDQDSRSDTSSKRKREGSSQLIAHFRHKKPTRRTDGILDVPS
jgi:hypothetical protein